MNQKFCVVLDEAQCGQALTKSVRTPLLTWAAETWLAYEPESVVICCPEAYFIALSRCIPDALNVSFTLGCEGEEGMKFSGLAAYIGGGFITVDAVGGMAAFEKLLRENKLDALCEKGVQIWDRGNCYVGPCVEIACGTELLPGCILYGKTVIGEGCTIGPNTLLEDTVIGDATTVNASQLYGAAVGSNTNVGPFTYVRPGTHIGDHVKAGDFVELKNANIGNGTKISHLTYIGDSDVGERVNFGCGTVVCNYDGVKKYRTTIGNDAFIGCNTNLVAPVTVGDGAYTAAGTTVRKDVPAHALSYSDSRQKIIENWAEKKLGKK